MQKHMKIFEKLQLVKEIITLQLIGSSYLKKKYYKMIPIDLSKQKALNSDPKAIQQINFGGNLSDNNNIIMLMIQEAKEKKLDFYIKC